MFYLRFHWLCLLVAKFLCRPDYKLQSPIIQLNIHGGVAMKAFYAVTEVCPVEFKEVFIQNLVSWWDLLMGLNLAGMLCLRRRNSPGAAAQPLLFLPETQRIALHLRDCLLYLWLVYHCGDETGEKNKLRRGKICFGSGFWRLQSLASRLHSFRQLASQKHCRRRVWQKLLIASRKQRVRKGSNKICFPQLQWSISSK